MKLYALAVGSLAAQWLVVGVQAQSVTSSAFGDLATDRHATAYQATKRQEAAKTEAEAVASSSPVGLHVNESAVPAIRGAGRSERVVPWLEDDVFPEAGTRSNVTRVEVFPGQ